MMSDGNPREWFRRWIDWLFATLDHIRDIRSKADPVNSTIRYQTIVVPRLGKMNRNGRIYTREMAKRICGQMHPNMCGQIGMPDSTIQSLFNVSHRIHSIFIVDNDLWAEYSILNTPQGRLLYDLFQNVGKDEFVLRPSGVGSIRSAYVQDNYEVTGFHFIPTEEDAFRPYSEEDVLQSGPDAFGDKLAFYRWMDEPNEAYEGMTPRQLMEEGRYDDVMMGLGRIQHGIY